MLIYQANIEGLDAALGSVGYMLLGLVMLALVLSLRLGKAQAAEMHEARSPAE